MIQEAPYSLIRLDLLLEAVSGIIALIISHQANLAFRLTKQKRLSDLSTGFLVLSAGMLGRVVGTFYFFVIGGVGGMTREAETVRTIVTIAYGFARIMAYILFVISTRRTITPKQSFEAPIMALPFLIDPNLEVIAILILVIVVLQALLNYASVRTRFALYVFVGFGCLLLSHIFGMLAFSEIRAYAWSQLLQFLGLLSFLMMLIKADRTP